MYMRYYLDETGNRVYTLKVIFIIHLQYKTDDGQYTYSVHPARFSPDDKFSHERIVCKSRFNLMLTQKKEKKK